jgi:hypothetical protein
MLLSKFCAHANVHQLLGSIWYEGLPGFRRMNVAIQVLQIILIGTLFPVLSLAYTIAPYSSLGKFIRKPFIKFICHSASYITFLSKKHSQFSRLLLTFPAILNSIAHTCFTTNWNWFIWIVIFRRCNDQKVWHQKINSYSW